MQIQCHDHPMQDRYACGCGRPSSSGVRRSETGVHLTCYSHLPRKDCLLGSDRSDMEELMGDLRNCLGVELAC